MRSQRAGFRRRREERELPALAGCLRVSGEELQRTIHSLDIKRTTCLSRDSTRHQARLV